MRTDIENPTWKGGFQGHHLELASARTLVCTSLSALRVCTYSFLVLSRTTLAKSFLVTTGFFSRSKVTSLTTSAILALLLSVSQCKYGSFTTRVNMWRFYVRAKSSQISRSSWFLVFGPLMFWLSSTVGWVLLQGFVVRMRLMPCLISTVNFAPMITDKDACIPSGIMEHRDRICLAWTGPLPVPLPCTWPRQNSRHRSFSACDIWCGRLRSLWSPGFSL